MKANLVSSAIQAGINAIGEGIKMLGSALTASMKTGMDFEAAMSRVGGTAGASKVELQALTAQAVDLGAKTSFSSKQAAEGMENLASAGFSVTEIMDAMPGMLNLAASSGEDLSNSASIAAATLRGFGLEAKDAGHVSDVFAKSAADTNASVGTMGEAMKYIAPVAHAMGLSLEETAAAIGVMSDAGIMGSQAGTTLRAALSRLTSPTEQMSGAMKDLGMNFFDAHGNMLPLPGIIEQLRVGTTGLTQEQKNQTLAVLFGQEALSGMLTLVDAGPQKLQALTDGLRSADGAAAEMASTMLDNVAGSIEALSGSMESIQIALFDKMKIPFRQTVDSVTESMNDLLADMQGGALGSALDNMAANMGTLIERMVKFAVDALPGVIEGIAKLINGINTAISVIDALSPLIISVATGFAAWQIVSSLSAGFTTLITALEGVSAAMTVLLAHPVILAIAGITTAVTLGITAWNKYKQAQEESYQAFIGSGKIVNELANDLESLNTKQSDISSLKARFIELSDAIATGKMPTNELTIAQNELATVKQALIDKSGGLIANVAQENSAFLDQITALEGLTESQKQVAIAKLEAQMSETNINALMQEKEAIEQQTQAMANQITQQSQFAIGLNQIVVESDNLIESLDSGKISQEEYAASVDTLIQKANELNPQFDFTNTGLTGVMQAAEDTKNSLNGLTGEYENQMNNLTTINTSINDYTNAQTQLNDVLGQSQVTVQGYTADLSEMEIVAGNYAQSSNSIVQAQEQESSTMTDLTNRIQELKDAQQAYTDSLEAEAAKRGMTLKQWEDMLAQDEERMKTYVQITTDMFSQIAEGQAQSVESMITNLEHNAQATEQWRQNLDSLYGRLSDGILQKLETMGIEGAAQVKLLADSSDEELQRLSASFDKNMSQATTMAQEHSEETKIIVSGAMKGMVDLSEQELQKLPPRVRDIVQQAGKEAQTAQGEFEQAGRDAGSGFANGIESKRESIMGKITSVLSSASSALSNFLQRGSPSKLYMGYGEDTGEGYAIGLNNSATEIEKAAMKIPETVSNALSDIENSSINLTGNTTSIPALSTTESQQGNIINNYYSANVKMEDIGSVAQLLQIFSNMRHNEVVWGV